MNTISENIKKIEPLFPKEEILPFDLTINLVGKWVIINWSVFTRTTESVETLREMSLWKVTEVNPSTGSFRAESLFDGGTYSWNNGDIIALFNGNPVQQKKTFKVEIGHRIIQSKFIEIEAFNHKEARSIALNAINVSKDLPPFYDDFKLQCDEVYVSEVDLKINTKNN